MKGNRTSVVRPPWRELFAGVVFTVFIALVAAHAAAQEAVKVGLILPMTGPFTNTGKQVAAGARLYMEQHGGAVAGKRIEIILRDDGGVADTSRRIAQELLVNAR
jgi:branched-chain amino acid transport system substrate-binding protein